ncbi:MAG: hypothetical protein ACOH2L_15650 [Devosia sp.]
MADHLFGHPPPPALRLMAWAGATPKEIVFQGALLAEKTKQLSKISSAPLKTWRRRAKSKRQAFLKLLPLWLRIFYRLH